MKKILKIKNYLIANRTLPLTLVFAGVCLSLFRFFSRENTLQTFTIIIAFFFLVPWLYIRIILKKKLKNFGWQIGDWKAGLVWSGASFLVSAALGYLVIYILRLPDHYSVFFRENFWLFLANEVLIFGLFTALYEFFFRGFLMFYLEDYLGKMAPAVQFPAFLLFFWLAGFINWQNIFYIVIAFFSGFITYKSRSIIYSIAYGTLFILIADSVIIYITR